MADSTATPLLLGNPPSAPRRLASGAAGRRATISRCGSSDCSARTARIRTDSTGVLQCPKQNGTFAPTASRPTKFTRARRKWSPLHYAILNGSAVVATELLDQGAHVDALFDNATPLVLVACEDPRYPTPVSSSSVDDRPYGGVAVRLFMAEQTHTPLTPVARRKLMRLLLDRGASPHAIRNAHRVTDDARTILRQYYAIVVHLNAFGTASSCPNPARLSAIDLVPTIASYVI